MKVIQAFTIKVMEFVPPATMRICCMLMVILLAVQRFFMCGIAVSAFAAKGVRIPACLCLRLCLDRQLQGWGTLHLMQYL